MVKIYHILKLRKWHQFIFKNVGKDLSNIYSQKLLDSASEFTTNTRKTALKRAIQKTAEATGDLIGNKIDDKITGVSKKSPTELLSKNDNANNETEIPKRNTYLQKKDNKLLMNQDQYSNIIMEYPKQQI